MKFVIKGPTKLNGSVKISGDKNTALKLIPATLLTDRKVILHNVPNIGDVQKTIEIAKSIGSEVTFINNTLTIQTKKIKKEYLPDELTNKIRTGIMFIPSVVYRNNKIKLSFPGGCAIGKRPIDAHINGLKALGMNIKYQNDYIVAQNNKLRGTLHRMHEFSVTGTEIMLIASAFAKGMTEIRMAAVEPSVIDLTNFLEKLHVRIYNKGHHNISIEGIQNLTGYSNQTIEHTIIPDRIEAATMIISAIATEGNVLIENCNVSHLDALFEHLERMNANFKILDNKTVHVYGKQKLKSIKLHTRIYPGFPTDMFQPMTILMLKAHGKSEIFETIYENRLNYLSELELMGGELQILNPHQAIIFGPTRKFRGRSVTSHDLRAGATMILAGLIAHGITEISNITYIDRGYEKLDIKLKNLGANITRINK